MSQCYAVASGKGGVGKSTITANLAAALAMNGKRVIIIDADIGLRSQDALLSMENRVVYDLIDLVKGDCLPDQAVLPCESIPSLFLLPAAQFARAKALDPEKFSKLILQLRPVYDYIFIDCPAGIERGLRNVLRAGIDDILLIMTPDDISLRSAERAVQVMESKGLNRPMLIVNRLEPRLIRAGEMISAKTAAEVIDLRLMGEIPEDPVVCRAMLKHSLCIRFDCEARSAIIRIASRLQGKDVPLPAYGNSKENILARLFRRPLKEVIPIDDY